MWMGEKEAESAPGHEFDPDRLRGIRATMSASRRPPLTQQRPPVRVARVVPSATAAVIAGDAQNDH
jgi:hypothetical protein